MHARRCLVKTDPATTARTVYPDPGPPQNMFFMLNERDPGPVLRFHLWHRHDETRRQHGPCEPEMTKTRIVCQGSYFLHNENEDFQTENLSENPHTY